MEAKLLSFIRNRYFLVALSLCISFAYGVGVGRYQVFPYHQIQDLFGKAKFSFLGQISDTKARVKIIKSSLMDVRLREFILPIKARVGGGAAFSGDRLYFINSIGDIFVYGKTGEEIEQVGQFRARPNGQIELTAMAEGESRFNARVAKRAKDLRYNDVMVNSFSGKELILVSYTHFDIENKCFTARVDVAELAHTNEGRTNLNTSWELLYETNPCFPFKEKGQVFAGWAAGGRFIKYSEKEILLTVGDYQFNGVDSIVPYPALKTNSYGKVFRINIETGESKLVSYGHRNPQGIVKDRDGRVLVLEQGPQGGDEINIVDVDKVAHFGWPLVTHGTQYWSKFWPLNKNQGRHLGYSKPLYVWVPSKATASIMQVQNFHPLWEGDFLVGTLKAKELIRVRVDGERVLFSEPMKLGHAVRYILEGWGYLIIMTDNSSFFVAEPIPPESQPRVQEYFKGTSEEAQNAIMGCAECHSLDEGGKGKGPHLKGIVGRKIAAIKEFEYSKSLGSKNGTWTPQTLDTFIRAPESFASDTPMPNLGLSKEVSMEVISILSRISSHE